MKKFAIIVAAGSGSRMGSSTPKQFLLLKGKPIVWYSVNAFLNAIPGIHIILVLPPAHLDQGENIIEQFPNTAKISVVAGGETRFESVKQGIALVETPSIVFVHDGVRCLISKDLIVRCHEAALTNGSAIPVIASKDSVRLTDKKGAGSEVIDRTRVKFIQTPQTFAGDILLRAFDVPYQARFTDEATVVEASGVQPNLVEGEEFNIKVTTLLDLVVAEKLLEAQK